MSTRKSVFSERINVLGYEVPKWDIITLNRKMTLDIFKRYFDSHYQLFSKWFPDPLLKKILPTFRIRNFMTFDYVRENCITYYLKQGLPFESNTPRKCAVKEFKGDGWERTVMAPCYIVYKPSTYDFHSGDLLKKCLEKTFIWFKSFTFSIYSVGSGPDWIYLKTPLGSAYCSVTAIMNHDVDTIIKEHTDYFSNYYAGPSRKEYLDKSLAILETDEFKRFCKCLREGD